MNKIKYLTSVALIAQGAITIEVKPENLGNPGDTFVFEISLTTHSVDLSYGPGCPIHIIYG